jgi:hypothetical protein
VKEPSYHPMLCVACGVESPEYANFCSNCGSVLAAVVGVPHGVLTDAPASYFYPASPSKVFFLSSITFGFYATYWFWSQWRTDDPNEGRGWVLFKTALVGFFFYSMANDVKDSAIRREVPCRYSPAVLTALVWITALTIRFAPDPWPLAAIWVLSIPPTVVQLTINRVNWAEARRPPRGWRTWEIILTVVLALVWVLAIIGLLLPSDPASSNA